MATGAYVLVLVVEKLRTGRRMVTGAARGAAAAAARRKKADGAPVRTRQAIEAMVAGSVRDGGVRTGWWCEVGEKGKKLVVCKTDLVPRCDVGWRG